MPKIPYPELQAIIDRFEALIEACEAYRDMLQERRPPAFRSEGRGGVRANGDFKAEPLLTPPPPFGTPEFRDFGYNRHLVKNAFRTQDLIDLLEGEGYDRLRQMIDGVGTMESARKGEWV